MRPPVTDPHRGAQRRGTRDGRSSRWSVAVFGGAMLLALGVTGTLGVQTVSADARPSIGPSGELLRLGGQPDQLGLELIGQDYSFGPNGDIHLEYRLVGTLPTGAELTPVTTTTTTTALPDDGTLNEEVPDPAPPPPELTLQVANYPALESSSSVDAYIGGRVDPDDFTEAIDGVLIIDLREHLRFHDDGSITFSLDVPTDVVDSQPERLKFATPGLYPLRVQLRIGDPQEPDTFATHGTIVQRLPGPDEGIRMTEPIDLALLAAIPDPGPLADDAARGQADDELDAIATSAAAVSSTFTLALPPSVVSPATSNPADQEQLSQQLADDELLAMPAVPFDVSAAVAADQLEAFALDLRRGEDLLTQALPTIPSRRDVWLASDPLSAGGAQALRDLGTRLVVMTPELYRSTIDPTLPATDLFVEIALPDGGSLPLLIIDPLGAEFTAPATTATLARSTTAEWSVAAITKLLLDQRAGSTTVQRSRVVATPEVTAPDPRLIVALEEMAATTPNVRFTSASALSGVTDVQRDGVDPVRVELPTEPATSIVDRVALLRGTGFVMANAASMLPADDPRPGEWTAILETLVPTGYPTAHVEGIVEAMRAEADALTGSIVPPEPFTFTLTGKSGDIDMRIGNTGDEPLDVKLRLSSPKLTFPDGDQIVRLRPNAETSVIVPVRARANGTSLVTVELLTPIDQPLAEPVLVTSRVNALTGLGQVLMGGLIVVLLTWWFSHWRTRRRATAAASTAEHTEAPDGPFESASDALTATPAGPAADLPPPRG